MKIEENRKKGLVLGGGGAKGCYEIGAWQAFEECGIKFDCVVGTSIGAIVGAIYTQQTIEKLVDFVYAVSPGEIVKDFFEFPEDFNDILQNQAQIKAFLERFIKEKSNDITPLINNFKNMFDYKKFKESKIEYACMTFNFSKMQAKAFFKEDISEELAINIIMASASCFPAFPMMEIEGDKYIDGGYANNVPIDLIQQLGATDITVVDVHGPGKYATYEKDPSILYIEPILPLGNFLDFRKEQGIRSLRLGYLETMKYLDRYIGYIYTFNLYELEKMMSFEKFASESILRKHNHIDPEFSYKAICSVLGYRPKKLNSSYFEENHYCMLIEALALCAGIDAVRLNTWDTYLKEIVDSLNGIEPIKRPESFKDALEILKNAKKEDIIVFLHKVMIENNNDLPLIFEPLKTIFDVSYTLASMWCLLEEYLEKA